MDVSFSFTMVVWEPPSRKMDSPAGRWRMASLNEAFSAPLPRSESKCSPCALYRSSSVNLSWPFLQGKTWGDLAGILQDFFRGKKEKDGGPSNSGTFWSIFGKNFVARKQNFGTDSFCRSAALTIRSGRGTVGRCTGPKMAPNGQNGHFGQNDLVPNRNFNSIWHSQDQNGPQWSILACGGLFRSI